MFVRHHGTDAQSLAAVGDIYLLFTYLLEPKVAAAAAATAVHFSPALIPLLSPISPCLLGKASLS